MYIHGYDFIQKLIFIVRNARFSELPEALPISCIFSSSLNCVAYNRSTGSVKKGLDPLT